MNTATVIQSQARTAEDARDAWKAAINSLPPEKRQFETLAADADGRVDGRRIETILADLMAACGDNPFEWISARSLAPNASFDTFNRVPTDWQKAYRWLEVSVVHGGSEGWVVHVRGVLRDRQQDGKESSELLVAAKALNRSDAWRAAEIFACFFDC
jgi:hypothetical protein